jgi:hypothetical protein
MKPKLTTDFLNSTSIASLSLCDIHIATEEISDRITSNPTLIDLAWASKDFTTVMASKYRRIRLAHLGN